MENRSKKVVSKLCNLGKLETRFDFEEKLDNGFQRLQSKLSGLPEKEAHDVLVAMVSSNDKAVYESVSGGLLYGILTNPSHASNYFRDLGFITSDSWTLTLSNMNFVLIEWYYKLKEEVLSQILWFFREAIRSKVPRIDNVLINLLKCVTSGGDFGSNSRVANEIVSILDENKDWLSSLQKPSLIPAALSAFLRLSVDHGQPPFDALRSKELNLCKWMLTEKFHECCGVGRDLIMMLMRMAKASEIEAVWTDIEHNPSALGTSFHGLPDLFALPVQQWLLDCRITVPIRRKLDFLMKSIKFGNHERHLEWFSKQYLSGIDCNTLRADLVRYICTREDVNYPPDTVPRWFILHWLLPSHLSQLDAQFIKLAMCWDWICFDPSNTTVSMIEPLYFLMLNTLRTQSNIANTMLDFMIRPKSGAQEEKNIALGGLGLEYVANEREHALEFNRRTSVFGRQEAVFRFRVHDGESPDISLIRPYSSWASHNNLKPYVDTDFSYDT